MSRLDCGPSLYNYTAALSGAHLVFPSASRSHLAPISRRRWEISQGSSRFARHKNQHKCSALNFWNGSRDYQPGAQGRTSSQIFWIRPTRPSAKETVLRCLEKAKPLYPSGIIRFVFPSSASQGVDVRGASTRCANSC